MERGGANTLAVANADTNSTENTWTEWCYEAKLTLLTTISNHPMPFIVAFSVLAMFSVLSLQTILFLAVLILYAIMIWEIEMLVCLVLQERPNLEFVRNQSFMRVFDVTWSELRGNPSEFLTYVRGIMGADPQMKQCFETKTGMTWLSFFYNHCVFYKLFLHWVWHHVFSPYVLVWPALALVVWLVCGMVHVMFHIWNVLFPMCGMVLFWLGVLLMVFISLWVFTQCLCGTYMSLCSLVTLSTLFLSMLSAVNFFGHQELVERNINNISHTFHGCGNGGEVLHFSPRASLDDQGQQWQACANDNPNDHYYAYWTINKTDGKRHFFTNNPDIFETLLLAHSAGHFEYPEQGLRVAPAVLDYPQVKLSFEDEKGGGGERECVYRPVVSPWWIERNETHACAATGLHVSSDSGTNKTTTTRIRLPSLWAWLAIDSEADDYLLHELWDDFTDAMHAARRWNWRNYASWDDNDTEVVGFWRMVAALTDASLDHSRLPFMGDWVDHVMTTMMSPQSALRMTRAGFSSVEYAEQVWNKSGSILS